MPDGRGAGGRHVGRVAGARRCLRAERSRGAVSLRPLSLRRRETRAIVARRTRDAGGPGCHDRADSAGHARLAGHLPPPVGAREVGGDDRPHIGRPPRARARRWLERGGARGVRVRLPVARRAHGAARGAAGDRPPPVDRGLRDVRRAGITSSTTARLCPGRSSSRVRRSSSVATPSHGRSRSQSGSPTSTTRW